MDVISSSSNATIKLIRRLLNEKKYRDSTNMFCVETKKIVEHLISNKFKIKFLLIDKKSKYINEFSNTIKYYVEPSIFNSLSELKTPDGIIGVFEKSNNELKIQNYKKYFILDKVQNPNNLGTIARTCIAFNIDGIIIINGSVDIYNPQVIRSSMGAIFNIPIKFSTDITNIITTLKQNNFKIYATALKRNATSLEQIKFNPNTAILFGNEGNGLSDSAIKLCDETIFIPINPNIDSLNIAASASIIA
jgi:TrmH family RNA methyltransferase